MRSLRLAFVLSALIAWQGPAAANHIEADADSHEGRIGVLPEACVVKLEDHNVSERTALIAGGATAAAVGLGAAAGMATGGTASAALLAALWLGHLPLEVALLGGSGYLTWNYFWPDEETPGPATPPASSKGIPIGWSGR